MAGNNATRGRQNRAVGQYFEQMIDAACRYYREACIAEIDKTPEPVRQLSGADRYGRFTACYAKKGQPDYKGTLFGGGSVVFEAKITTGDRISQSVVLDWQDEALTRHEMLGATCFVLVSFDFKEFYRIPWDVWRNMKERYGRKYLKPEDIPEYRVKVRQGMIDFLTENE